MKKHIITSIFIALSHLLLKGQNGNILHCGFPTDSISIKKMEKFDFDLRQNANNIFQRSAIIIPVVVHIVKATSDEVISDETIFSQIDVLNRDFNAHNADLNKVPTEFKKYIATSGIRFCLTHKDTNSNATSGIIRVKTNVSVIGLKDSLFDTKTGGSTAWNPDKFLNIWVANTGNYITGIGSYPNLVPPYKSGIIVHPRYFGKNKTSKFGLGRVAVHEVGHYLGLYHIWGKTNDTLCETGDEVADTPPQLYAHSECPSYPQYSCGQSSMFMNTMDYVNDPCMLMFTEGQMQRMLATISTYRKGLLNSDVTCMVGLNKDVAYLVYPNPTTLGQININLKIGNNTPQGINEGGKIRLFNYQGQLIIQRPVLANINELTLDLLGISNGLYLLSIEIAHQDIFLQKLIVLN